MLEVLWRWLAPLALVSLVYLTTIPRPLPPPYPTPAYPTPPYPSPPHPTPPYPTPPLPTNPKKDKNSMQKGKKESFEVNKLLKIIKDQKRVIKALKQDRNRQ